MYRLDNSAPLCEGIELFGGIERKNRGREIEFYKILELPVAGITEKENRFCAARVSQGRAFLPDRDSIAFNASAF